MTRYAGYILILAGALFALATCVTRPHAQSPSSRPGCVYNATPPSLSDKQMVSIQCDASGHILVQ